MDDANDRISDTLLATDLHIEATYRLTEALVEAENRMRRRVELLSEIVLEVDADGCLVFLNRSWRTILDFDPDACLGRRLSDFAVSEDRESCVQALASCASSKPLSARRLLRWRRADGDVAWMELSLARLADGGSVGALHDVTKQKRVQDEAAKLSLVASYTQNMVVITDQAGRTEWVNRAFERRTGYSLGDMVGRKPGEVLQGPGTDRAAASHFGALLNRGEAFEYELVNYTKSGEPYWVKLNVTPVRNAAGDVEQYIAIQTDSTELHRTQEQLSAAKERAEVASEAKTQFLATISHEMRTPLNAILGSAELALLDDGDAAGMTKHVRQVQESAGALLRLITDMLDVSKIEAGHIVVEREPFDVRACLESAVSGIDARARAKGLAFSLSCDEAVPAFGLGDAGRVRQIVSNLAENAVKFTNRGAVSVKATMLGAPESDVTSTTADASHRYTLEIRVVDTGAGISPAAQMRMFDRFVQGDSSITRRHGGAGLGLNIVKSLATAMGGSVAVHSHLGAGAEFCVRLPCEVAAARIPGSPIVPMRATTVQAKVPVRSARILVAEDTDINFVMLEAFLKRGGYAVMRAHNGRIAVDSARKCDLVIMDVEMPDMDGLEATRRIRADERERGAAPIPIIAVTAHAVNEYRERCLAAGCTAYLTKPVSMNMMLEAVSEALRA